MFKNNVARAIDLTTFSKTMLLEPLADNILKNNVSRTIGFTAFSKTMLLKPLVLQQLQK